MNDIQRFNEHVIKDNSGCWVWTGELDPKGYGMFSTGKRSNGTQFHHMAHRFAYKLYRGEIPDGLVIDHLCRNRSCVNPDHLEIVTNKVNILRGISPSAFNAKKTHCPLGHVYDEQNTFIDGRGMRECRTCRNERRRINRKVMRERG